MFFRLFARAPEPLVTVVWPAVTLAVSLAGCRGESPASDADAGVGTRSSADATTSEARPSVLSVDFTVIGCPDLDLKASRCRGPAPLTITFVPISTAAVNRYVWEFGDGATSFEDAPAHAYAAPGSYAVSLVGLGSGGTARKDRSDFVVVTANKLGDACDVDAQCEVGLQCTCGGAAGCPSAFARGLCTRSCRDTDCPEGSVCADLSPPADTPPNAAEPWRAPLCLRVCQDGAACVPGQPCRLLPLRGSAGTWQKACFPDVPADVGAACRAPNGELRASLCLTNTCADLGALGVCSASCAGGRPCPPGTACAALSDGRRLCLRPCGTAFSCNTDPLLGCVAADGMGPLGFTVRDGAADATYCAPKRCQMDADCGSSGRCQEDGQGGNCVRR